MNTNLVKIWNEINLSDKQEIFKQVGDRMRLSDAAVEKDWWVVRTLELVF